MNRIDPTGLFDHELPEVVVTGKRPTESYSSISLAPLFHSANRDRETDFSSMVVNPNQSNYQLSQIMVPTPPFIPANNKGSDEDGVLKTVSTALAAIGITADNAKIFVKNIGGKQVVYVTLKGNNAVSNIAKVKSALKGIGTYTFYLGVFADAAMAAAGQKSWFKAAVSTGVGRTAMKMGGWPGLLLGTGYIILDNLGAFDGAPANLPHYQPSLCPQDATKVVIPISSH